MATGTLTPNRSLELVNFFNPQIVSISTDATIGSGAERVKNIIAQIPFKEHLNFIHLIRNGGEYGFVIFHSAGGNVLYGMGLYMSYYDDYAYSFVLNNGTAVPTKL